MEAWVEAVVKEITIEDLPGGYQEIGKIIGVENAVKLSEKLGGLSYYFPQLDAVLRKKRDQVIQREFKTGKWPSVSAACRELAIRYGLTEVWIREIIDREAPQQPALF